MSQEDRVWFVTGASSGFGRALADAVIARGERAVVAARRREALAALAAIDDARVLPSSGCHGCRGAHGGGGCGAG
jgi:NAD(P)-dependent dehydrogenase (short-subunit alcohol dehydrogenase family)